MRITFVIVHGPIELLKWFHGNPLHLWNSLHSLLAPLVPVAAKYSHTLIKRRNARLAQHWPVTVGQVLSINVVAETKFAGIQRRFCATFKYSYTVQDGSEITYFSGDFFRPFPDKERAWEWLELLKNKRIRVHYKPGHPEVSSVLTSDLDAHFSLPARTPADFVFSPSEIYPQ
jgi:hypothetical protein